MDAPPPPPPPPSDDVIQKPSIPVAQVAPLVSVPSEGREAALQPMFTNVPDSALLPANGIPRLPIQPPGGVVQTFRQDGDQVAMGGAAEHNPVMATVCPTVSAEAVGGLKGDEDDGDGDEDDDDKDGGDGGLDDSMDMGLKTKQQRTHHSCKVTDLVRENLIQSGASIVFRNGPEEGKLLEDGKVEYKGETLKSVAAFAALAHQAMGGKGKVSSWKNVRVAGANNRTLGYYRDKFEYMFGLASPSGKADKSVAGDSEDDDPASPSASRKRAKLEEGFRQMEQRLAGGRVSDGSDDSEGDEDWARPRKALRGAVLQWGNSTRRIVLDEGNIGVRAEGGEEEEGRPIVTAVHCERCICNGHGVEAGKAEEVAQLVDVDALDMGRQRVWASLRGTAFLHRGVKAYHCKWDTYAGDAMLLLAGVSQRSAGPVREDAEKRFWRIAAMFEARYQNWSSCGAAAADPEGNSGDVLCLAEGLLAFKWMGVDIHARPGLRSVWEGVRQALSEQCEVVELFGFDPREGVLPMTKRANCNNCTSHNDDDSARCRYCGWVLRARPQYEDVTDALVWCYILEELAIPLSSARRAGPGPVNMRHVLAIFPQLYPYLPKEHVGTDLFKQQCYCVTHLILALSKYGRLALAPEDFASESKFLRHNMRVVVEMRDPELVGEFVDCLAVLGAPDRDLEILRGRRFLLQLERERGGRGRWTDTDATFYRHYHSSWCGVVGLMPHSFQAVGPMYKEEWALVAEASRYWAGANRAVVERRACEGMPAWNLEDDSQLLQVGSMSSRRRQRGENSGVLSLGKPGTTDLSVLGPPLGMESGDIQDHQISASSEWESPGWPQAECRAALGRLHRLDGMAGCWIAADLNDEWIQVDLLSLHRLTGVATQGRGHTRDGIYEQWVTTYKVLTRKSRRDKWVQQGGHLAGNTDAATAVGHAVEPVECRYVRLQPTAWFEHVSMRVELYGERLEEPRPDDDPPDDAAAADVAAQPPPPPQDSEP